MREFRGMEDGLDLYIGEVVGEDGDGDPPDAMRRAAEDAARDMIEDEDMSLEFVGSYMVQHTQSGACVHGVIRHEATDIHQAVGLMYFEVKARYGMDEGWSPPSIHIDPNPYAIVVGGALPIADGDGVDGGDIRDAGGLTDA